MKRASHWLFMPERPSSTAGRNRRNTSIGGLSFALEIEGENIPMRISERALRTIFAAGKSPSTWLEAYRKHAGLIDQKAVAAHLDEPDRPVCLDVEHFPGFQA